MRKLRKITLIYCLILMPVGLSYTINKAYFTYYEHNFGAKALGLSNAFSAIGDDLSSIWANPAGLTFLKHPSFYINYRKNAIIQNFDIEESGVNKFYQELSLNYHGFNFFSISAPVILWNIQFNFAISYYRYFPYGISGNLSSDKFEDETLIEYERIAFNGSDGIDVLAITASFLLNKYFSFGFTYQTLLNTGTGESNYTFKKKINNYQITNVQKITGSNFIIGFIFKLHQNISIAFACETRIKGDYSFDELTSKKDHGDIEVVNSKSSSGSIIIPFRLNLGAAIQLSKFLNIYYDHKRVYWSKGNISNYFGNTSDLPFPAMNTFTFEQKDLICNRFGIEGILSYDRISFYFRGGLFFDRQFFVDMNDEKVKIRGFSLGLGIDFMEQIKIDLAYMYRRGQWMEGGTIDELNSVNTTLKDNIFSISLSYAFINRARVRK